MLRPLDLCQHCGRPNHWPRPCKDDPDWTEGRALANAIADRMAANDINIHKRRVSLSKDRP